LERLHRALEQERWEIEHHRQQERDELRVLYAAKGFEGKLLEDVLDVLMADNERLLKVMVEEEMGLTLGTTEHPLKQGLGAAAGVFIAAAVTLGMLLAFGPIGAILGALATISVSAGIAAQFAENKVVPAIVWNLGIAVLSSGILYCLLQYAIH
jgi:VIT1/CCC1 family predicted Fe2+/Mn2+ transporter